jgi:hypothetical protein
MSSAIVEAGRTRSLCSSVAMRRSDTKTVGGGCACYAEALA